MPDKIVCAIIITYNSDIERLENLLNMLASQAHIIICDNSTYANIQLSISFLAEKYYVTYLRMQGNVGIASAQNAGIELAAKRKFKFVFLLDDDSVPGPNLLNQLVILHDDLVKMNLKVGAVGARALDSNGVDISNSGINKNTAITCSQMMSSGVLIPTKVIRDVGFMDDSLFIDCVDFDWGWRAISKGYQLYLAPNSNIQHSLGDGIISFGLIRFGIPSPVRHYYQYRNILKMISRTYVPKVWKIKQIITLVVKLILFPLFVKPRVKRFRYMILGLMDWSRNINGKCPKELA